MLSMQDIGYFLYMQEQEEKKQKHKEVNVNYATDLVEEQTAPNKEENKEKLLS